MSFNAKTNELVAESLYRTYFLILYFFMNIYKSFFPIEKVKPIVVIDPLVKYIDFQKDRFINMKFNDNIDDVFYSKKDYQKLLTDADNYLEKKWKRNILFENTPRGNIIMYYDVYKQGFSYYSDSSSVSYDILNAVAMKYVYFFRCKDFFIDQNIATDSRLINIHFVEEKTEKHETKTDTNRFDGAPFAKFKNYNTAENKVTNNNVGGNNNNNNNDKKPVSQKLRNKFIHLGKVCNFKLTQPINKKNPVNGFKSKLLETLSGETQLQKEVLSYKNYKLAMSKL